MPWWVILDNPDETKVRKLRKGPYASETRADSVVDNYPSGGAFKVHTHSWNKEVATQEINDQLSNSSDPKKVELAFKNFKYRTDDEL